MTATLTVLSVLLGVVVMVGLGSGLYAGRASSGEVRKRAELVLIVCMALVAGISVVIVLLGIINVIATLTGNPL